jgi:acetyltransferase-like isoleucine patch superfamily enzyme
LVFMRSIPSRIGIALRYVLLRRIAQRCGDNVAIFEDVHLYAMHNAGFGSNVSIHPMSYIDATGGLTIGSDVAIAHSTTIMTTEHDYSQRGRSTNDVPGTSARVTIGNDVWIGCGVRVLAGVTIGDHVVIGAGAIVTKDIPPNSLAVGVPARVIKKIRE